MTPTIIMASGVIFFFLGFLLALPAVRRGGPISRNRKLSVFALFAAAGLAFVWVMVKTASGS